MATRRPSNYKPYTPSHGLRSRGGFNVEVQYEGDWVKFNTLVNSTDIMMVAAAREGQRQFAEEYRDAVKQNISEGGKRFGYNYTSPKYQTYKSKWGGGGTLLRWTDSFMDAVEIIEGGLYSFMVGIRKGMIRSSTNEPHGHNSPPIHEYANILERGYPPNMPPRPIFSDTLKQIGGKARIVQVITTVLGKRLLK